MRSVKAVFLLVAGLLLMAPSPAHAWFGFLEELSGPGPFTGAEYDFKLVCFMERTSSSRLFATAQAAAELFKSANEQAKQKLPTDFPQRFMNLPIDVAGVTEAQAALALAVQTANLSAQLTAELNTLKNQAVVPGAEVEALKPQTSGPQNARQRSSLDLSRLEAIAPRLKELTNALIEKAVPRVSKFPGAVAWASCSDKLRNEPPSSGLITHQHRHSVISIVLNYRDLANTAGFFHIFSELARDSKYAGGDAIHLRILEPKISKPVSGHFDFLDAQAGMGVYHFSSAGFQDGAKSFSGFMVEPIRFDLHAPGSWVDRHGGNTAGDVLLRIPLSVSVSAGVLLFPQGFTSDKFNPGPGVAHNISGGEAIFEWGIVVNVGRLFGL